MNVKDEIANLVNCGKCTLLPCPSLVIESGRVVDVANGC